MLDTTGEAGARAEGRLRNEEIAWLTTVRPDGQPQSVPVWSLWDGEAFLVYFRPGARKLRNIEANSKVNLNLNSKDTGGNLVRVECAAEVLADAPPPTEVGSYLEKYREAIGRIGFDPEGFARAYSAALRATPTHPDVGGPEVGTLADSARRYLDVLASREKVVEIPLPGGTARAIRDGALTCPGNRYGEIRWEEFLRGQRHAAGPGRTEGAVRWTRPCRCVV